METLALRDGDILPTQEVLEAVLGSSYPAFEELNALLISMEIRPEWVGCMFTMDSSEYLFFSWKDTYLLLQI